MSAKRGADGTLVVPLIACAGFKVVAALIVSSVSYKMRNSSIVF